MTVSGARPIDFEEWMNGISPDPSPMRVRAVQASPC